MRGSWWSNLTAKRPTPHNRGMTFWQWLLNLIRNRVPAPLPPPITPPVDQSDILAIVNRERTLRNLQPYRGNSALTNAAQAHAAWMMAHNDMTHGGDGTMEIRITATGYSWSDIAENVAEGYQTPSAVIAGWMGSPGHRANLLGPYRDVGFGRAGNFWCADFGTT